MTCSTHEIQFIIDYFASISNERAGTGVQAELIIVY